MNDPQLARMSEAHFPQLAAALRACSARALSRWEQIVREVLPHADELTFTQLRDDMPQVLKHVADSLEVQGARIDKLLKITSSHGELRFHQQYNLNELLIEYDLLRPILLEEIVQELKRPVQVAEVLALDSHIGTCARRSILSFVEHQSRELRTATEAQSKYLSFLSHDLRGGLNGVFLMIEVLRRELQGEERLRQTMDDLDSMRRSLLETVGTMDRFLHAERFRKGKVQVQAVPINVGALLAEIAAHFSYQAREKGLTLRVTPADCRIVSDRELLTMILQNLLSNAIKYSKKGEIRAAGKILPEGGCVLTVQDDGPGISAERLTQIFAPFSRGETHGEAGVGLGLSIAQQAADLLGAKIRAESAPGVGSTFFVELPKEAPAPALPKTAD